MCGSYRKHKAGLYDFINIYNKHWYLILKYFEDNIIIVHFVFLIFSNQIHTALMSNRTSNAVEEFSSLSEYYIQKQHSKCQNLLQFLKETILFWYNILKDKLSRYLYIVIHWISLSKYWMIVTKTKYQYIIFTVNIVALEANWKGGGRQTDLSEMLTIQKKKGFN